MDRSDLKPSSGKPFALVLFILVCLCPGGLLADSDEKNAQIHITSDMLVSDRNGNYAEFQGNVVAVQEGSTLTSDRLKITYTGQDDQATKPDSTTTEPDKNDQKKSEQGIETIVASGKVKMTMDDKTAWAEVATFNRKDDTIILTGGTPRVVSGQSTISGEKIIMNRQTGQISVFRGEGRPVEAIFYEEDMDKADKTKNKTP